MKGRGALAAAFGALGLLYLLSLGAYYVGFFNDDAFYIIGAKSLLSGRYAQLNVLGEPPLISYLPGFSLLLAPVALFAGDALWPYQLVSIAFMLAALWLFWGLASKEMQSPEALASCAAAWASPLAVSLSGTVLSDVPYLLLSIVIVREASRRWKSDSPRVWLALGALSGFAALLRPTGAAFPLALIACLAWERRWRPSACAAGASAAFIAPFLIRNRLLTGAWLLYAREITDSYGEGGALAALFQATAANLASYLKYVFVTTFFRWPWDLSWLSAATIGACLAAVGYGAWKEGFRDWRRFLQVYLLAFVGIHLVWSKQAGRYFLPVLPFAAAYIFRGVGEVGGRLGLRKQAVWGVCCLSLALSALPAARIVKASLFERTPLNAPPERTFEWVRINSKPEDVFAVELDGRFYLHTGRKTAHLRRFWEPENFRKWLERGGAGYVALFPTQFIMKTRGGESAHDPVPVEFLRPFLSDRRLYEKVFEDAQEGSTIYKVVR